MMLMHGCGSHPDVPSQSTAIDKVPVIYPDYTDVTIPSNIAPINFMLTDKSVTDCVARLTAADGTSFTYGDGRKVMIDEEEWAELLKASTGKSITVEVFARKEDKWLSFKKFAVNVAREPVDSYISYRLIEPSYIFYDKMNISQRETSSFEEKEIFKQTEANLDFLNHELVQYIVRLNALRISEADHHYLTNAIRSVGDLERIGDYAENITEYADVLVDAKERFSNEAVAEIEQMRELVFNVYQLTMKAYMNIDREAYWQAHDYEDEVDKLNELMETKHVERMTAGKCSAIVGAQYIELASNSERISDHLINVGKTIGGLYPRSAQ